jgi:hypothetical protein
MFNKKKKEIEPLSPTEEATQKLAQERAQGLEDIAENIAQQGKEFIINSDILIGDYSSVMQLVNQKMGKWFNEQINDCKLSELLSLNVPEADENKTPKGEGGGELEPPQEDNPDEAPEDKKLPEDNPQ